MFFMLYSPLDTAVLLVLKVGTNENGSALWKVAIDQHLVRIVVINVVIYFNLAAILE